MPGVVEAKRFSFRKLKIKERTCTKKQAIVPFTFNIHALIHVTLQFITREYIYHLQCKRNSNYELFSLT